VNDRVSGIEDYLEFLQCLFARSSAQFLFGGQAVNFWADYFDRKTNDNEIHELHALRPFTSKDCDVWVSPQAWNEIQTAERIRLVRGTSPIDGQLGILTLQQFPLRMVDLMSSVYGIRHEELSRLCERAPVFNGIKVIDPIYLFRSKCHCLLGLDQIDRQDARHVRMLALILPEYLSLLINGIDAENLSDRALLKEIKLLRKILGTHVCRRALAQLEINPDSLIPWAKLETCGLDTLAAYARSQGVPGDRSEISDQRSVVGGRCSVFGVLCSVFCVLCSVFCVLCSVFCGRWARRDAEGVGSIALDLDAHRLQVRPFPAWMTARAGSLRSRGVW